MTKTIRIDQEDAESIRRIAERDDIDVGAYLARALTRGLWEDVPTFGERSFCEVNDVDPRGVAWPSAVHARVAELSERRPLSGKPTQDPERSVRAGMVLQYGDATEPVGSDIGNMTVLVLAIGERAGAPIAQVCPVYRAFEDDGETLSSPRLTLSGGAYKALVADVRHVNCDRASFPHGIVRHEAVPAEEMARVTQALAEIVKRTELSEAMLATGPAEIEVALAGATAKVSLSASDAARYKAALMSLKLSEDAYWTMTARKSIRADAAAVSVHGMDLASLGPFEIVREEDESEDDFALRGALADALSEALDQQLGDESIARAKRVFN